MPHSLMRLTSALAGRYALERELGSGGMATVCLWKADAAGDVPRLLVRFPGPERQSSRKDFTTGGKHFYFTIEDRECDAFVAELLP